MPVFTRRRLQRFRDSRPLFTYFGGLAMRRKLAIIGAAVAASLVSAPASAVVRGKPVHGIAIMAR